nr:MDIS1-interacting receptor like kinase 2-like [Tanacetum cinerariifolium]
MYLVYQGLQKGSLGNVLYGIGTVLGLYWGTRLNIAHVFDEQVKPRRNFRAYSGGIMNTADSGAQPRQGVDVIKEVLFFEKEQKLKDQLRRGNCVLKKLRQCREDDEEDDQ